MMSVFAHVRALPVAHGSESLFAFLLVRQSLRLLLIEVRHFPLGAACDTAVEPK
jgi:hypothetical protein